MRMASTFASTGRSIKNLEIIVSPSARSRRGGGLHLWIDLLPWDCPQQPSDDHAIVRRKTAFDHAHGIHNRPDLDLALFDRVVLTDHQHVAAALVAAERNVRHEQLIFGIRTRNAHAS